MGSSKEKCEGHHYANNDQKKANIATNLFEYLNGVGVSIRFKLLHTSSISPVELSFINLKSQKETSCNKKNRQNNLH
jgi:hypothetical protein